MTIQYDQVLLDTQFMESVMFNIKYVYLKIHDVTLEFSFTQKCSLQLAKYPSILSSMKNTNVLQLLFCDMLTTLMLTVPSLTKMTHVG